MHDSAFDAPRPFSKWKVVLVVLAAAVAIYLAAFKLKSNPAEAKINRFVEIMKQKDAKGLAAEITEADLSGHGISRETAEVFIRDYFFANLDVVHYKIHRSSDQPGTMVAEINIRSKHGVSRKLFWSYSPLSVAGLKKDESDDYRFTIIFEESVRLMHGYRFSNDKGTNTSQMYLNFLRGEIANLKRIGIDRLWQGGGRSTTLEDCIKLHERAIQRAAKKRSASPTTPAGSPQP